MTKPITSSFANLESEYENIQKSLTNIDESIKKITGKDPSWLKLDERDRNRFRFSRRPGFKRRLNDSPEYENEDENDFENKRSIQSQVVSTSWESRHRDQVLEEQKNDKKSLTRNKRMFGLILGTLEKFKSDESQRKAAEKRAEIEQKLDQAAEEEREAVKRERERLFQERETKRIQMKCLEEKLQRVQAHKAWEKSHQYIGNFIQTKNKPHVFYMPAKHNQETQKLFQETKDKFKIMLAEKRAKLQKELNEIDERFKKEMEEYGEEEKKNGHSESVSDSAKKSTIKIEEEPVRVTESRRKSTNDENNVKNESTPNEANHKSSNNNKSKNSKESSRSSRKREKSKTEDPVSKKPRTTNPDVDGDKMAVDKEFEPIYD